jgi:uncharacterized protein
VKNSEELEGVLAYLTASPKENVKSDYLNLRSKASDCIECGICESKCPFNVKIIEQMRQVSQLFGE